MPEGDDTHTHGQDGYTMTVEEAATVLDKSVETVRRYIRSGRLPAQRVQGHNNQEYRLHPQDVEDAHTQLTVRSVDRAGTQAHTQPVDRVDTHTVIQPGRQAPALALVEALLERTVAPLAAANERLALENARLSAITRRQAEELGAARERARQAEERAAQLERAVRRQQRPWWLRLLG